MEVHKKLVKAAARNKEIIAQLEETDFAASSLATTRIPYCSQFTCVSSNESVHCTPNKRVRGGG